MERQKWQFINYSNDIRNEQYVLDQFSWWFLSRLKDIDRNSPPDRWEIITPIYSISEKIRNISCFNNLFIYQTESKRWNLLKGHLW